MEGNWWLGSEGLGICKGMGRRVYVGWREKMKKKRKGWDK